MSINRTSAEQEAFCKAWKQSELSKIEFCKQSNISKSALYNWLNKFNNNDELSETGTKNTTQSTSIKFLRINDVNSDKSLRHENNALLDLILTQVTGWNNHESEVATAYS